MPFDCGLSSRVVQGTSPMSDDPHLLLRRPAAPPLHRRDRLNARGAWRVSTAAVKNLNALRVPCLLTLNQRVQGSNPCTPTNEIRHLVRLLPDAASQKSRLGSTWEAGETANGATTSFRPYGSVRRQRVVIQGPGINGEIRLWLFD